MNFTFLSQLDEDSIVAREISYVDLYGVIKKMERMMEKMILNNESKFLEEKENL